MDSHFKIDLMKTETLKTRSSVQISVSLYSIPILHELRISLYIELHAYHPQKYISNITRPMSHRSTNNPYSA